MQIYPTTYEGVECNETECVADACMCSHEVDLPLGHVVQLVLFTNLPPLECNYKENTFSFLNVTLDNCNFIVSNFKATCFNLFQNFHLLVIGITGTAHPVHIHGHKFQVVKIGHPTYNQTTGLFERNNGGMYGFSSYLIAAFLKP